MFIMHTIKVLPFSTIVSMLSEDGVATVVVPRAKPMKPMRRSGTQSPTLILVCETLITFDAVARICIISILLFITAIINLCLYTSTFPIHLKLFLIKYLKKY